MRKNPTRAARWKKIVEIPDVIEMDDIPEDTAAWARKDAAAAALTIDVQLIGCLCDLGDGYKWIENE